MSLARSLAILFSLFVLSPTAVFAEKPQPLYQVSIQRQYQNVQDFLFALARRYPQTVTEFTLGISDQGQPIKGVIVGTGNIHQLVVAAHHGNEYGSTELALAFAESLAQQPILGQSVHIIPVLNISGYARRQRTEMGHDPNRDYPGPCGSSGPFLLQSTRALDAYLQLFPFLASATLHTFHPAVLYPWGLASEDVETPYNDLYIQLARRAAAASGYAVGNSTVMLYPANGTFEDYAFHQYGIWSLLFELGSSHRPNVREIESMNRGLVPGLRSFFEAVPPQRATQHAFSGRCSRNLYDIDLKNE